MVFAPLSAGLDVLSHGGDLEAARTASLEAVEKVRKE